MPDQSGAEKTYESFGMYNAYDLARETEPYEKAIIRHGINAATRYPALITEAQYGRLRPEKAFDVASVESLALCLDQQNDIFGILTPIDTRFRYIYRQRRQLQLTGDLKDLGDRVALIASGVTVPEILGFSTSVDVLDPAGLAELMRFRVGVDLMRHERASEAFTQQFALITHNSASYVAFDPDLRQKQMIERELSKMRAPELSYSLSRSNLSEFIHSDNGVFSSLVWLRMEPLIIYGDLNPDTLNPDQRYKVISDIFVPMLNKLKQNGQLYATVGIGDTTQQKNKRLSLMHDMEIFTSRMGFGFQLLAQDAGPYKSPVPNPNGDVMGFVLTNAKSDEPISVRLSKSFVYSDSE